MENFLVVARQVAVLFALIGVGAVCRRMRLLGASAVRGMVNVLLLLVTPSLIVDAFQRPFDSSMLAQLGLAFLIALALHAVLILVAHILIRTGRASTETVLRLAVVFSNAGFMGIPLEQAVLGEEGVFFGIIYVAVFNVMVWSWGLRVMRGMECRSAESRSPWVMFVNPGTVGLALGLPLFLFSVSLPGIVHTPVRMMASLNTPLAMLVIGYYLAGAHLGTVVRNLSAHVAAIVRLIVCPLVLTFALYPFRSQLDRVMMLSLVAAASAPVAATVTMFASKYGRDVDLSVGVVSGTTILSIVTMPTVIALAMSVL